MNSKKEKKIQNNESDSDSELDSAEDILDDSEINSDNDGKFTINYNSVLNYKPTTEEKQKLCNMLIRITHTIPPQHTIEKTAGTRTLRKYEREEFEKHTTLKIGKFSNREDKILKRNWKNFCQLHDWDPKNPKPFLQMKHKNKEFFLNQVSRQKFTQFLANGLLDRSLYSVYQRFKVIFDPHKKSRYKSYEDDIIVNFIKENNLCENNRKFADLALILKRTRASVWRRYRVLKKKHDFQFENHIS